MLRYFITGPQKTLSWEILHPPPLYLLKKNEVMIYEFDANFTAILRSTNFEPNRMLPTGVFVRPSHKDGHLLIESKSPETD